MSLGYRVLAAADGEEALPLCAEDTPAIAILDVIMPKLGGVATAQKLAANFRGLPVLFTSAPRCVLSSVRRLCWYLESSTELRDF